MSNIDFIEKDYAIEILHKISDVFGIGKRARTPSVILQNVKNCNDDIFCRYKKVIEFLEGKSFKLIKRADGYLFIRPGSKPDAFGKTIVEAVEKAIEFEEEIYSQDEPKLS